MEHVATLILTLKDRPAAHLPLAFLEFFERFSFPYRQVDEFIVVRSEDSVVSVKAE